MGVQQEPELSAGLDAEALDGVDSGHDGHVEVVDIEVELCLVVADSRALHGIKGSGCECEMITKLVSQLNTANEADLHLQFTYIASHCGYGSASHGLDEWTTLCAGT